MKITVIEMEQIAAVIYSQCGIVLDNTKRYLLENRLDSLIKEYTLTSYTDLFAQSKTDTVLLNKIFDAITTNETSFFRDQKPFKMLKEQFLPDWRARQNGTGSLKIWSSACSTGQEVYSILILLKEFFANDLFEHDIKVIGTDISISVITKASTGIYSDLEIKRGLTPAQVHRYFDQDSRCWKIKDELRQHAYFEKRNLLKPFSSLGRFDIIFCRNVAIYFSEKYRSSLFNRIANQLTENGILVIGSTETLFGISNRLIRRDYNGASYYVLR